MVREGGYAYLQWLQFSVSLLSFSSQRSFHNGNCSGLLNYIDGTVKALFQGNEGFRSFNAFDLLQLIV